MIKFNDSSKIIGRFDTLTKDLHDTELEGISPEKKFAKKETKFGLEATFGIQEAIKEKPAFGVSISSKK